MTSVPTTGALDRILSGIFGYSEFLPHQREFIEHVIAGGDAFVLMPTGGGKSLCFQVPALQRPGTATVVSPLISLMKDQVDALLGNGVAAAHYNSSLDERARGGRGRAGRVGTRRPRGRDARRWCSGSHLPFGEAGSAD